MSATTQTTDLPLPSTRRVLSYRKVGLVSNGVGNRLTLPVVEHPDIAIWDLLDVGTPEKPQYNLANTDGSGFLGVLQRPQGRPTVPGGPVLDRGPILPNYIGLVEGQQDAWTFRLEHVLGSDLPNSYKLISDHIYPGNLTALPGPPGVAGEVQIVEPDTDNLTGTAPGSPEGFDVWQLNYVLTGPLKPEN